MKMYDAEPDVKAYVYQQVTELEPLLPPASAVTVYVRKSDKSAHPIHSAELNVVTGDTQLQSRARSRDVYTAVRVAKSRMLDQLHALQNVLVSSQEREMTVRQILDGNHILH